MSELRTEMTTAAEAYEVQADRAEAIGNVSASREFARLAAGKYEIAAEAAEDDHDQEGALQLAKHAKRCYERGFSWQKAKVMNAVIDAFADTIARRASVQPKARR